jgi:hypothetical protein
MLPRTEATPSETSTRVSLSRSTTRSSTSTTWASLSAAAKARTSSISSDLSTVRTGLKPTTPTRSPNATPVPKVTTTKKMSTSIPSLASRRISMPVQNFPRLDPGISTPSTNVLSKSTSQRPNGAPQSVSTQPVSTKSSHSVSGSVRSTRSTSLHFPESPLLLKHLVESPQRTRVASTPPRRNPLNKSTPVRSGLYTTPSPYYQPHISQPKGESRQKFSFASHSYKEANQG